MLIDKYTKLYSLHNPSMVKEEVELFLERDRDRLDAFSINELIVLSNDLHEKAQSIEHALRADNKVVITTRRPMIGCLDPLPLTSSECSTTTSDGVKVWNLSTARSMDPSLFHCAFISFLSFPQPSLFEIFDVSECFIDFIRTI